jgi:hypothetical protein
MAYQRVIDLNNRNEADVISSILKDNNINYSIHCLEDSAFDGLFTGHMIWGYIEVEEEQKDLAIQLHKEYLDSTNIEVVLRGDDEKHNRKAKLHNWFILSLTSISFLSAVVFLILFMNANDDLSQLPPPKVVA